MKKLKLEGGANLVEFAFVLPLLVVLALGIVDFSLALFNMAVITNASREGARAGMAIREPKITTGEIQAVVTTYCQNHLVSFTTPKPDPTTTFPDGGPGASGSTLTVEVDYPYDLMLLSRLIPAMGTLNLRATSTMRVE